MTKLEVLCWGMRHIAANHKMNADVEHIFEDGEVCLWSMNGTNIPAIQDVRFLCEDLGLDTRSVEGSEYGVDVWIYDDDYSLLEQEYTPTGMEMWKRYGVEIGS